MASSSSRRQIPLWIPLLFFVGLLANGIAWLTLGALPDEAYYWVWSRQLQWGYFDHPPLVAWMIRLSTELLGNSIVAIRLPAVLTWLASCGLAYLFAWRIYQQHLAGALAALIWATLPIVQAGFHVVTPDAPLILFSWLGYYLCWQAVKQSSLRLWILAGICAGLALLGKYPAILLLGVVFLALLSSREGRRELATSGPWLAALIALLMFVPVVWWNYQHDWISFAFQLGHGIRTHMADPWHMFTVFLVGQLGVVMPWTFFAMLYASLRPARWGVPSGSFVSRLLVIGFWLPLLLFGAAGLSSKAEANWPLLAYLPGTLLLAGAVQRWLFPPAGRRAGFAALAVSACLVTLLLVNAIRFPWWLEHAGIELPPQRTQLSQSYGWPEVGAELQRLLAAIPHGESCRVMGASFQGSAMLGLLLGDAGRTTAAPDARISQYTLWQNELPDSTPPCLYVEQFDRRARIREHLVLEGVGSWRRVSLLELDNPDLTTRWFGFFVPEP